MTASYSAVHPFVITFSSFFQSSISCRLDDSNNSVRRDMLQDFFKLNETDPPVKMLESPGELTEMLSHSNDLRNAEFRPSGLTLEDLGGRRRFFTNITFTNVSFAKTEIQGIDFRQCTFVDCLFIGTRFVDCEFHDCAFEGCNPYKIEFSNTYINPSFFEGTLNKVAHSNIGIHLFQELYKNAADMGNGKFARAAEFNLYKWQRYIFDHDHPKWEKFKTLRFFEWSQNVLFWTFAGYGIRPKFLIGWAAAVGVASVVTNYIWWDSLKVVGLHGPVKDRGFIEVIYYTVTTLGRFGDLAPGSDVGKSIFVVQAMLGLVLVSLFVTWLVRRALR